MLRAMTSARYRLACVLAPPLALLLASCGQSDNDPGPGGVSVGEARALDDAAAMIEQRRLPPDAVDAGAGGGQAPEPPADSPAPEG